MDLWLLDESLRIRVYYDRTDSEYEDNVCISLYESCPEDEKILKADEVNIFLTTDEARQFARLLQNAAQRSRDDHQDTAVS